jgi:hypothetical protein
MHHTTYDDAHSGDGIERLRRLVQAGDHQAWRALAKACARRDQTLDLAEVAPPWQTRQAVVEACAVALQDGCALRIGAYLAKPYKGDLWRGVECWLDGRLRERWWGGVGAEEQAAHWLFEHWLGREAQDLPKAQAVLGATPSAS